MIIEACVDNYEDALLAETNGAQQIELCDRLDLDGLTPKFEMAVALSQMLYIPVKVMIRPRIGDFAYKENEFNRMIRSIQRFQVLPIAGFVFGVTKTNKKLDYARINELAKHCQDKSICIHKSIDQTPDIIDAFESLKVRCPKVDFVLTSGGRKTAYEGRENLKKMKEIGGDDLKPIAAGSITPDILDELHQLIDLEYYHGRNIL